MCAWWRTVVAPVVQNTLRGSIVVDAGHDVTRTDILMNKVHFFVYNLQSCSR